MKILMISTSYPRHDRDTSAPFIASIAEGIAALGHDVKVVLPFHPQLRAGVRNNVELLAYRYPEDQENPTWGYAQSLQADVKLKTTVYWLAPLAMHNAFRLSLSVASEWKPDLIHSHWVLPNGFVGARLASKSGIPLLVSLHGSDMFLARKNSIFQFFARYSLRKAAAVTACSPDLQEQAEVISKRDVLLLEYGVDIGQFKPSTNSPRKRHSIFAVGRLVHKKGFHQLIEAFVEVKKHYKDSTLTIAGDGPLLASLKEKVDFLGLSTCVNFPGNIDREALPVAFREADAVAVPSVTDEFGNRDGLPNVLLEALSSGCAVVASDIPGIRNVMQDRTDGILVRSGDTRALAEAVLAVFNEETLAERLRTNARAKAEKELSWEVRSEQLQSLYNRIRSKK